MSKQFINELNRMKDLFGYKKGQVISEQLTTKQIEAVNAGYPVAISDEAAKKLPVGPDGKIIPKKVNTSTNDEFATFPCIKNFKTEKKATGTNIQGPTKTGVSIKIGEGNLKQYMFGSDGTLYSYGQEYGKWSCGTKPNTVMINGKEVSVETTLVKQKPIITVPKELKDKEGVKKFQDWLDGNKDGWLGKPGVKLAKGKGYGNFGPRTKAAWAKYKNEYLQSSTKIKYTRPGVTDADAPVDDEKMGKYAAQTPDSGGLGVPTDDGELYADNY
jgi:hypothetical protein